jgi:hypothetical protein
LLNSPDRISGRHQENSAIFLEAQPIELSIFARMVWEGGLMLKRIAVVFGVVFLLVGFLGFVPAVTRDGHLLGIFHVNAAHNMVHILTGIAAIACGLVSDHAAQLFFRVFGVIYSLVAVLGFVMGDQPIFGIISNNLADAWLHTAIAAVSLFVGFGLHEAASSLSKRPA